MMENKRKLYLYRGIQGSGKTTAALAWVREDPEHRVRINNDDIRNMLGLYWVPNREPLVSEIKQNIATNAMSRGYDIVVDNMNLNPKEVKFWQDIVKQNNEVNPISKHLYEIEFKDFFISLEECIRRDAMRSNPIGEKVIRDTWKRYKFFIQTHEVEKLVNNLVKQDENKPHCIVVDMDSTLCFNTTKRPWYGEGAAEGMINDIPNMGVLRLVENYATPGENKFTGNLIIATGRDTSQAEVTKQWLAKHNLHPQEFYFRTNGDFRKGVEVKKEQIIKIMEKYHIDCIIDDCEPIVEMYREMGLTVLQPNKGL